MNQDADDPGRRAPPGRERDTRMLALLRTPFFLTTVVGRVGIAMTSLGLVLLVHARTGSYVTAGLVTGGLAVAEAVAGPQLARLVDRFGQPRVLPPLLLAHAAAVALIIGSTGWVLIVGGILAGATIPQLGALSAARWAALLPAGTLPRAFALEALANELAYLVGPALVSSIGYPVVGTALAAGLVVLGGLGLAWQRHTAPPIAKVAGSLLRPRFVALAGVSLALGGFFGAMPIAVTAFAVEHHSAAAALFATSSSASLLAGWLYGLRRRPMAPRTQLALVTAGLAIGCLALLAAASPLQLGFGVTLTGLAVPVIIVLSSVLTEAAVDRAVLTQAFAWLASAGAAGSAFAAAAAGWAVDAVGPPGGFTVAATFAALMAVIAGLRLA